jgi:hypothetical protein
VENPEPMPFIITISNGSLSESLLVQLFSNPQQTQASMTKIEPAENFNVEKSSTDKMTLAMVINIIAVHVLFPTDSLKIINATREVATISKLFKSEAVADVDFDNPIIKNIGAKTSKTIIATT